MPNRAPSFLLTVFLALLLATCTANVASAQDFEARLDRVKELVDTRQLAQADSSGRALLQSLEDAGQADSIEAARVIYQIVQGMLQAGRSGEDECLELATRSLALREAHVASDHAGASPDTREEVAGAPDASDSTAGAAEVSDSDPGAPDASAPSAADELAWGLNQLARVHRGRGDYAEALPPAERSLEILLQSHDAESVKVSSAHNTLGAIQLRLGNLEAARERFQRVLDIRRAKLEPGDPQIAEGYHNLAVIYLRKSDFETAEPLLQSALAIRQKAFPPDHPLIAATLSNIAQMKVELGQNAEAAEILERLLPLQEASLGPNHPRLQFTLNALASANKELQNYGRARELFERCVKILEEAHGPTHVSIAFSLLGLSQIKYAQGDTREAIRLAERAVAILEEELGSDHVRLGQVLSDLADYYRADDRTEDAMAALDRAEGILTETFGAEHVRVAHVHQVYGDILREEGQFDDALERYRHARAIWEEAYGPHHRLVGAAVAGLAEVHRDRGEKGEAEALYEELLEIRRQAWGPEHRYVASALYEQSRLLADSGAFDLALDKALEAERIGRKELRRSIRDLDERSGLIYAEARATGAGLNVALSLATRAESTAQDLERTWDALIEARAFVLDEMALRTRALHEMDDPEVENLRQDYADATNELAQAAVDGNADEDLDAVRRTKEALELRLASASAAFRAQRSHETIALDDVVRALPPASALVAFVRYEDHFEKKPAYGAFTRSTAGDVAFRQLGPAADVEARVAEWILHAGAGAAGSLGAADEMEYRIAGAALREQIWDPLRGATEHAETVFVVLDGELSLVNLAALPTRDDRYLVEEDLVIHALSAERELLEEPRQESTRWQLLALGNPDFDVAPGEPGASPRVLAEVSPSREGAEMLVAYRGEHSPCPTFQSLSFRSLPGTGMEIDAIGALWDAPGSVLPLEGAEANEAAFKVCAPQARVLHLATHGFFLGESCELTAMDGMEDRRGVGSMAPTHTSPVVAAVENPLLRSGLALAGANRRGSVEAGGEDGILTAEEIATLDLGATEWAVLSACDTGVGEVQTGEGVLGLRRAFRIAGVRTVVMSLWEVRDAATVPWMRALYTARIERGLSTAAAVRAASRSVLDQRRQEGASTHPYYWAAFIAAGDWR